MLLGAVSVAVLPEWRQRAIAGLGAPGNDFISALHILKQLWQAQLHGGVVKVAALHSVLRLRYERIEALLETMRSNAWVSPASPEGWVLHHNPQTILVSEIYRLFVFDPGKSIADAGCDAELVTFAREYESRVDATLGLTLTQLFENAMEEGNPAMSVRENAAH